MYEFRLIDEGGLALQDLEGIPHCSHFGEGNCLARLKFQVPDSFERYYQEILADGRRRYPDLLSLGGMSCQDLYEWVYFAGALVYGYLTDQPEFFGRYQEALAHSQLGEGPIYDLFRQDMQAKIADYCRACPQGDSISGFAHFLMQLGETCSGLEYPDRIYWQVTWIYEPR